MVIEAVYHEWEQYAVFELDIEEECEDPISAMSKGISKETNNKNVSEMPDDTEWHRLKKENLLLRRRNKELTCKETDSLDMQIKISLAAEQKVYEKEEFEKWYYEERKARKLSENLVQGERATIKWQAEEIKKLRKYEKIYDDALPERLFMLKKHAEEVSSLKKQIKL